MRSASALGSATSSAVNTTLPLARKVWTSSSPTVSQAAQSSSLVIRCPPTLMPRKKAA